MRNPRSRIPSHVEFGSQINFAGFGIIDDEVARAADDHFARFDEVGAINQLQSFAGVVVGDEDAQAAIAQAAHNFLNFKNSDGIDAAERFIEQKKFGSRDERAGNFKAPFFAAAQRVGFVFGQPSHVQFIQQIFQTHVALFSGEFASLKDGQDVLFHGKFAENGRFLGEIANAESGALVHREAGDVAVLEFDHAGIGRHYANDHIEGGRFSGAIGPEQADDLAGGHRDRNAVHHATAAVLFYETFRAKQDSSRIAGRQVSGSWLAQSRGLSGELSRLAIAFQFARSR